jgi:acetyl-CoA carboxylase biotin carboxyl carrier protein
MDLRKLKKLIDLVEESSITELEINDAEERVRIVKHGAPPGQQVWPMPPAAHAQAATLATTPVAATVAAEPELPEGDVLKRPWSVLSTGHPARVPNRSCRLAVW